AGWRALPGSGAASASSAPPWPMPRAQTAAGAAAVRQVCVPPDRAGALTACLRQGWPKRGAPMDTAEAEAPVCTAVPSRHRPKPQSTTQPERSTEEETHPADVVGPTHGPSAVMPSLPNEASIARLHDAALRERHLQHRSTQIDGMADLDAEQGPTAQTKPHPIPKAARTDDPPRHIGSKPQRRT
ncbi:MAG: hypothetical protein AAGA32_14480, partial [Pseudomonadota bacterium]